MGADPEVDDGRGVTPLIYAAVNGHDEVVATLLAAGADPTRKDNAGRDLATLVSRRPVRALAGAALRDWVARSDQ